jgi:acetoin:2,6-dichlorophenolindophenol oxidoreductase subunit beta
MSELEFRAAIRDALAEELERDDSVLFFGEDVAAEQGGVFAVTPGLQERFGTDRVFDTPISELALAGAAFGAATTGMRPVIEIMFGDFMGLTMDSLVNQAAKLWYVSNEQGSVPLVVRSAVGAGGRFGAMHSQSHGTWFQGIPGIKVAAPSSPADAKGLLKAAIRDDNPVIFLEHKRLYSVKGPEPESETVPLGQAAVVREGGDLTIVSISKGVRDALQAADTLAGDGLEVEVVDLRTLRPLDLDTVLGSVGKTNRVLAVEEGPRIGGWATGLLGLLAEAGLHDLDDAWIVATEETPIPYSPSLEDEYLPSAETIVESVRARLGTGVETSA